jgi:hypothetical protein
MRVKGLEQKRILGDRGGTWDFAARGSRIDAKGGGLLG